MNSWMSLVILVCSVGACARQSPAPPSTRQQERPAPGEPGAAGPNAAPPVGTVLPAGTRAICPVSKEEFTVTPRTEFAVYKGKTYVFCCADCKPDFEKNPAKYAVP